MAHANSDFIARKAFDARQHLAMARVLRKVCQADAVSAATKAYQAAAQAAHVAFGRGAVSAPWPISSEPILLAGWELSLDQMDAIRRMEIVRAQILSSFPSVKTFHAALAAGEVVDVGGHTFWCDRHSKIVGGRNPYGVNFHLHTLGVDVLQEVLDDIASGHCYGPALSGWTEQAESVGALQRLHDAHAVLLTANPAVSFDDEFRCIQEIGQ